MQDFRNLKVWQTARRFTRSVYELTSDFPRSEEFGLKAQMRRASVSVCSTIAEGCGRRGDREFRRFLDISMGSCCELECELILSFDLAFITEAAMDAAIADVIEIKRMIGSLVQRLRIFPEGTEADVIAQRRLAAPSLCRKQGGGSRQLTADRR